MQRLRYLAINALLACQPLSLSMAGAQEVPLESRQIRQQVAPLPQDSLELGADAYIIGPGDVLELKLFDAPDLSGQLEVLND